MNLLTDGIKARIQNDIVANVLRKKYDLATEHIIGVLKEIYANIPDGKRISYGRVYAIQVLSRYLFSSLVETHTPVFEIASDMFTTSSDSRSKAVSLGILSFYGIEDYQRVLPFFESSASSADWNMREIAQTFFRKIIQKYPSEMKDYLLQLVKSEDANIRRFVGETLRPVQENRWFYEDPEYPLSILRNMFKESSLYPRTSVGNNLSDLARHLPEIVYGIVKELVESSDINSFWIGYRACRNLVKKEPLRVMDLLELDEYRYKKKVYKRSDYQGDRGKVNSA